jgi:ribose transport system substrate-binding protein
MKGQKVLATLLATSLTVSILTGCGSSSTNTVANGTSTSAATNSAASASAASSGTGTGTANGMVAHPDQTYYMVTFMSGYSFWQECWRGFQDAASLLGVKAEYGGSQNYDINEAVTSLQQIAATKPSAMAVTAMDADAYKDPIDQIVDSGIPVVMFDSDSPNSKRTTFLGTSNRACGVTAANYIGDAMGGKGTVLSMTSLQQTNINEREIGFDATMDEKYPGIKYVTLDGASDQTKMTSDFASALTTNPETTWIFAQTQAATLAAQTALSEAGLTGKVKIMSFDTDETTLDSIDKGEVEATITQSPYCEGFWSLIYSYMLVNQDCMKGTDGWYSKGYPSLPATGDSGSMVVTKDLTYMFHSSEASK